MPKIITEDMIEQAAIKALQERHNYTVLNCMTEEPDTLPDGTDRSYGVGRVVSYSCFRRFNVDQLPELSEDP